MFIRDIMLRNIGLNKERGGLFFHEAQYIPELYCGALHRVELGGGRIGRLVVGFHTDDWEPDRPTSRDLLDVYEVTVQFDFNGYWKSSTPEEKKLCVLNAIHEQVLAVCAELDTPTEAFETAYMVAKLSPPKYTVQVLKPKSSPNRKYRAVLYYEYRYGGAEIFALVYNKNGELHDRYSFWTGVPSYLVVDDLLGKLVWKDNQTLRLSPKVRGRSMNVKVM